MGLRGSAASVGRNEGAERLPSTQCGDSNVAWCTAQKFFSIVKNEGDVIRIWGGFPASACLIVAVHSLQQRAVSACQRGGGQKFGGGEVLPTLPRDEPRANAHHQGGAVERIALCVVEL